MIIVSDTSPLSNLFIIQRLDLLQQLYGKIIIPEAVMNELLELEKRGIDLSSIKTPAVSSVNPQSTSSKAKPKSNIAWIVGIGVLTLVLFAGILFVVWMNR